MTNLSVNINKIALLRNSRGRDYPNLVDFTNRLIELGVDGITVHPRQDQRHITTQDVYDLGELLENNPRVELNIEGYPSDSFVKLIDDVRPDQCTFVPDTPTQLTSDHGWDLNKKMSQVTRSVQVVNELGVRSALFLDADLSQIERVPETGANRVELYTEDYARAFMSKDYATALARHKSTVQSAEKLGIGVNAGHDLDLNNLKNYLEIGSIQEVSIGHALITEAIDQGIETMVEKYLKICRGC